MQPGSSHRHLPPRRAENGVSAPGNQYWIADLAGASEPQFWHRLFRTRVSVVTRIRPFASRSLVLISTSLHSSSLRPRRTGERGQLLHCADSAQHGHQPGYAFRHLFPCHACTKYRECPWLLLSCIRCQQICEQTRRSCCFPRPRTTPIPSPSSAADAPKWVALAACRPLKLAC